MSEKLAPDKRHSFLHNGEKVFEWDQTLEEVNIYINLPPNVDSKQFYCKIQSKHVEVGIRGNPPYLNHDLFFPVKTDSSFWTLEDDVMHITLQKRDKGQTWSSPILGQGQLDPYSTDLVSSRSASCFRGSRKRTLVLTSPKLSLQEAVLIQGRSWAASVLIENPHLLVSSLTLFCH
ncbi:hypothetical protein GQ457_07G035210 [Hibiscus cannabinus]